MKFYWKSTMLPALREMGRAVVKTLGMCRSRRTNSVFFAGVFLLTMFQFFIGNYALRFWLSYLVFAVCGLSYMADIAKQQLRRPFVRLLWHTRR